MSQSVFYYQVAVKAPLFKALTYASREPLSPGQRVHVPLGSKVSEGLVLKSSKEDKSLKNLKFILKKDFLLEPSRLRWLEWMSSYYHYPLGLIADLSFPPLKEKKSKEEKKLPPSPSPPLTPEQKQVVQDILKDNRFQTHLLYGVTGSGKTEIYKALAHKILSQNQQILILIPEIFLISQIANKFLKAFPGEVALLHSQRTSRQKTNEWWDLVRQKKNVLIGTRSSLFCPLPQIGLIIVDEEHEDSFKQEEKLRYHARDSAIMLSKLLNKPIVLGSATPHLSSWFQAKEGRYKLHTLKKRALNQPLPPVTLIDLRKSKSSSSRPFWLSEEMQKEIKKTLERKKQVALFLNRRGQASALLCTGCGFSKHCPNCDIALTLHKNIHLLCHYCHYLEIKPRECPECKESEWFEKGLGTEKVEEEIKKIFPEAKVLRADRDAIDTQEEMKNFIRIVEREEVDIVIGTQMLSKGLDFDSLEFVGILIADRGFHFPDFRAGERSFQMILQTAGRAGRKKGGQVMVQTFNPEQAVFQFIKNHDYESFASLELKSRKKLFYPPFCKILLIHISSLKEEKARDFSKKLAGHIQKSNSGLLHILGPSPAPFFKLRNHYRFQILMKAKSHWDLQRFLDSTFSAIKQEPQVQVKIDRDPVTTL